jgi:hypothetical protein
MRKIVAVLVVACLLAVFSLPALAKRTESTDKGYNFAKVRTILIMEPTFSNNGFDLSGQNHFIVYPGAAEKIAAILNGRLKKTSNLRYVTLACVSSQVSADPNLDCDPTSPGFAAILRQEMPKYTDLVLYLTIRDFGWFHEYKEGYDAWETVTERVNYHGTTPDGKDFSGWADVERQVLVYHPPHYDIYDSAVADFGLLDARNWKYVWSYTDTRTRLSYAFGKDYDHTGESMMNRIFDEAMTKMPVFPKPQQQLPTTYN